MQIGQACFAAIQLCLLLVDEVSSRLSPSDQLQYLGGFVRLSKIGRLDYDCISGKEHRESQYSTYTP